MGFDDKTMSRGLAAMALILFVAVPAVAEETKGKLRLAIQASHISISDEIRSNASNTATGREMGTPTSLSDPRDDRAADQSASINDSFAWGANISYGLLQWNWAELVLEGNYNYLESEVDRLEVSGSFQIENPNNPTASPVLFFPDCSKPGKSCYKTFPTRVGDISWHNPQIGALLRFRPQKRFNPYVGGGIGYYLVSFDRSAEIDKFSKNLEASDGFITEVDFDTGMTKTNPTPKQFRGIEVTADDDFEYHLTGGLEMTFKKRWTVFFESRFNFTDGHVQITTDGREDFGQSVPDGPQKEVPSAIFGVQIPPDDLAGDHGGLLDVGSVVQDPEAIVVCPSGSTPPFGCKLGPPDGILDPGVVYIQGGKIKYGGFLFSLGLRFTF